MPLSQALYLIKECLIGFERLFNRFGAFDITETMIAINEKGLCKVWINENFALNAYSKRDYKENKMINNIINIIESHCIESKSSKRLFSLLTKCSNFLQALKMVDTFAAGEKILVPLKFSFTSFPPKDTKTNIELEKPYNRKIRELSNRKMKKSNQLSSRSISPIRKEVKKEEKKEEAKEKHLMNLLIPPPEIKRFKSESKMKKFY